MVLPGATGVPAVWWRAVTNRFEFTSLRKALHISLPRYEKWLEAESFSAHTKRAYISRTRNFLDYLLRLEGLTLQRRAAGKPSSEGDSDESCEAKAKSKALSKQKKVLRKQLLAELAVIEVPEVFEGPMPKAREWRKAIDEYRRFLKIKLELNANSINNCLTALEHVLKFMNVDVAKSERETWPQLNIRALTSYEERGFVNAALSCRSSKDQALALLMLDTGIKLGECASLNIDDIQVTAHTARITVRDGRSMSLGTEARQALLRWLIERSTRFEDGGESALFLNLQGKRISSVSIDAAVRRVGKAAKLNVSAQVLRDTCLANMVRKGKDMSAIARFCGHRNKESTSRRFNPLVLSLEESAEDTKVASKRSKALAKKR